MTQAGATTTPGPLGAVARTGFIWQSIAFGVARLSVLLSTIVLARYLGPADYGFIALAVVLVTTLTTIADAGVSQATIYLESTKQLAGAALTVALTSSSLLALAWMLLAPPIAAQFGHASDGPMLVALGSVIVITSLGRVPDSLLRREMKFSRRLPAELARGLGRGGVAIVLAIQGFGPWSLVAGEIVGAAAYALVSLVVASRSRLRAARGTRADARRLLAFGIPATANGALHSVVLNVDYVVIASLLGTTAVGVYFVGFRVPEMVVLSVFQVFSQVAYPVYTRARHEPGRLGRAFLLALRLQVAYGLTAGAIIAATADTMVLVLFGEAYTESVAVMQAIGLYVVFRSLSAGDVDVFKAMGRPGLAVSLGVARLVVIVPALLLATRWGVTGVAVMQAAVALLFVGLSQRIVTRMLELRWRDVFLAVLPAVVVATGAGTVAWGVDQLVAGQGLASLVAAGVAGVATAAVLLLITDRRTVVKLVRG